MITCNHDPVRLLKTVTSVDGNVSCHWIRAKGFGSRIFTETTRGPLETILCHNFLFLIEKQIVRSSIRLFPACFGRKLRANKTIHNMIFGDSRSQRQSFSPFTTRRSNKIVFATHPCDHVQASCLPHEQFRWQFLALAVVWRRETRTSGFIMTRSDDC